MPRAARQREAGPAARLLACLLLAPATAHAADVAIVVNSRNPTSDVSAAELNRMLRLETRHWQSGGRIYLILLESGTREKNVLLRRLYRMDDAELRQYWLGKVYSGEIASYPRVVASAAAVKKIVSQAPNALGFIDAAEADASVKVLRIDGRRPGDSGYLLASAGARSRQR